MSSLYDEQVSQAVLISKELAVVDRVVLDALDDFVLSSSIEDDAPVFSLLVVSCLFKYQSN